MLEQVPTPPEPFGFKTGWIAVRSSDLKAVAAALPAVSATPVTWREGVEAAYQGRGVFVTPPVNGWICLVGRWAMPRGDQDPLRSLGPILIDLSARFGEAQSFATHRVIEYHHWIRAKQGKIERCFAYLGESGTVLCQSGTPTDSEKKLRFGSAPENQWRPSEDEVMKVAGSWSIDPSTLSAKSAPPANGMLVQVKK